MAATATLTRKRCADAFLLDAPAPPHLAKRGRFAPAPAPAAFTAQQQQTSALREENGALRARVEELERDNGVLKHGVAALHRREEAAQRAAAEAKAREEEAKREAAELRKKVAELEAANYALTARMMLGTDTCRFQAFHGHGPDVF